jgi:hypothetical protein
MIAPVQDLAHHPLVPQQRLSIEDVLVDALHAFVGAPNSPNARAELAEALERYIDAEQVTR